MSMTDNAFIRAYSARRASQANRSISSPRGFPPGVSQTETVLASAAAGFSEVMVPPPHLEGWHDLPTTKDRDGLVERTARLRIDQAMAPDGRGPHREATGQARGPLPESVRGVPRPPFHAAPRSFSLGSVGPDQARLRLDRDDGHVPPPHARFSAEIGVSTPPDSGGVGARASNLRGMTESSEATLTPDNLLLAPFHANWEVDAFQWPEICERLQVESVSGLSGLLRSVLHRAWRGLNVFGLTSFDRGEGNTTVTLCLGKLAALYDIKIAIVDGQYSHPQLADALGIATEHGWNDLSPDRPLSEIAIRSLEDQIVIFPMRPEPHEGGYLSWRDAAVELVTQLAASFELVLIDAGPMFQAAHLWFADAGHMPSRGGIVVRNMRRTSPGQLEDVCLRLQQSAVREVLLVENFQHSAETSRHV